MSNDKWSYKLYNSRSLNLELLKSSSTSSKILWDNIIIYDKWVHRKMITKSDKQEQKRV